MKRLAKFLLPLLLALAAGCSEKAPNPLEDALGAYILQGQEGTFRLYSIEKIDSTTFRTEFERRQNVFELKLREETKLYNGYVSQNKPKNAARHWESIQRTQEVIRGLDSLRTTLEGRLDEVAYYDYVFSGKAETDRKIIELTDTYASVTPELEVITLSSDRKDLHKAGGRAIPGYLQMLGRDAEEED